MADLAGHTIFDCDFAFYDTLQNCAHSLYLLLFHFKPTIPKTIEAPPLMKRATRKIAWLYTIAFV